MKRRFKIFRFLERKIKKGYTPKIIHSELKELFGKQKEIDRTLKSLEDRYEIIKMGQIDSNQFVLSLKNETNREKRSKIVRKSILAFHIRFVKYMSIIYQDFIFYSITNLERQISEMKQNIAHDEISVDFIFEVDVLQRQLVYKSIIIEIYSFLEKKLLELVNYIEKDKKSSFKVHLITGKAI